jgi:hypothetical protein
MGPYVTLKDESTLYIHLVCAPLALYVPLYIKTLQVIGLNTKTTRLGLFYQHQRILFLGH